MKPWLRVVRDVVVLVVLALLPLFVAACAAARGEPYTSNNVRYEDLQYAPYPQSPGLNTMTRAQEFPLTAARVRSGEPAAPGPTLVPPESLPARDEELWVIQKPSAAAQQDARAEDDVPGSGSLMTRRATGEAVAVPLKHTDVKASIAGYIATVDVTQQFHNPYDGKIEAVYVFPLPHNAAVNEFLMTVGDRRIRRIVRELQEAEKIYQAAKSQGYVASLLTQERPNIFTQAVANIEPGKAIDINVKYFHTLSYSDGWYEFVFPMVVGPRFNPPGSTDGIGAVGRSARGASRQKTEVQYLRPRERSGHDVALAVDLDAGVAVERIESRNHQVVVKRQSPQRAAVVLDEADKIPNRDFVLRWKVAGDGIKSGLLVHRDERDRDGKAGGYFSLMLVPPDDLRKLPRSPLEMVFALDVSGSMDGRPIAQAKSAVRWALQHMGPEDTFQIVRFSGNAEAFAPQPVPATAGNVRQAMRYLDGTSAGGGTMMIEGIKRSLEFPADESRPRCVAFLTDGYIGNEAEILGALHRVLGSSRVFSFGVGQAVNRYLMEHMARLGNGAVAYVGLNEPGHEAMAAYFERISHPALTGISLDFGGAQVEEVFPQRVPDLFVGKPVVVTCRFTGEAPKAVRIKGVVRGEEQRMEVTAGSGDAAGAGKALPLVWARMKIADLADRSTYEPSGELAQQIRQVALDYGLMSAYTAFVAVDSLTRTRGNHGTTVAVPVPVPAGVRYETTVADRAGEPVEK